MTPADRRRLVEVQLADNGYLLAALGARVARGELLHLDDLAAMHRYVARIAYDTARLDTSLQPDSPVDDVLNVMMTLERQPECGGRKTPTERPRAGSKMG